MAEQAFASTAHYEGFDARADKLAASLFAPEKPPEAAPPKAPEAVSADPVAPSAPSQEDAEPATEAAPEPEYVNLEDYLTKANLDREAFLSLPARVKVDGQESDVPLADILKSYQVEKHVQAKSISLAEKQKAWEAEQSQAKATYEQSLKDAKALSDLAKQQLLSEFQNINWNELYQQDPARWSALQMQFNNRAGAIENSLAQIKQKQDEIAQEQQRELQKSLKAEQEKMFDARPDWRDSKVFEAARGEMSSYARSKGFTDAELSAIYDHRYMDVLHDAARWAALQAKAPEVAKRVRTAPKAATPGARITRDPKAVAAQQARERFMKNPRDQDAQVAYAETLS